MTRFAASLCMSLLLAASLAACGEAPMGQSEGVSSAPADAPASVPPVADFSGDFDLVGTEPFWNLKIRPGGMSLTRPDHGEVVAANPGAVTVDGAGQWTATGMAVVLTPETCSDGMSDRTYDYMAQVTINGAVLKGCGARPADLAAQPRP
ncbi:hypothetical protein CSW58_04050 [Caulobacter sp. B11]|nr:hypothetical protein [Caulobacter sp. B11]PHY13697.1 hypothetical protein CSW58_04050 [Caulobacter sp. B11]